MTWVQIQKAQEATWDDYERVAKAVGVDGNPPEGLIVHAAGEENGKWRSVDVWESEAAYQRFRDERLMPAVREAMGEAAIAAGPPPQESFEVKHLVKP
jgi:heme-degrading monooxygenase HmoA